MKTIKIADFETSNKKNLILIAGPCVIESEIHSLMMAEKIATVCQKLKINFVYKSSFDKANRSSINSNRGIEIKQAEKIFSKIKSTFNCPILTDVHNESQCEFLSKSERPLSKKDDIIKGSCFGIFPIIVCMPLGDIINI